VLFRRGFIRLDVYYFYGENNVIYAANMCLCRRQDAQPEKEDLFFSSSQQFDPKLSPGCPNVAGMLRKKGVFGSSFLLANVMFTLLDWRLDAVVDCRR
jgi:hypothetical protein